MPSLPTTFNQLRAAHGFQVGSGSSLARLVSATASIDFANMAANASSAITATLSGALAGDAVLHTLPSTWSGDWLNINCVSQVLANDVVTITASNKSAGAINPGAQTVRFTAFGF